jgi:hypothetical protein
MPFDGLWRPASYARAQFWRRARLVGAVIAVAAVIALMFFGGAKAAPYVMRECHGGNVAQILQAGDRITARQTIVLDGPAYSACAIMVAEHKDRVCVTPRAALGIHQIRNRGTWRDDYERWEGWPPEFQAWITARGGEPRDEMRDQNRERHREVAGMLVMDFAELRRHFRMCAAADWH